MADIYDEIRDDHKNQRELLETISNAEDAKTRGEAWKKFYYDVKAHAAAEEETFYAKLIANPKGQDDARHSVAEHKQLDDLMEKLNTPHRRGRRRNFQKSQKALRWWSGRKIRRPLREEKKS